METTNQGGSVLFVLGLILVASACRDVNINECPDQLPREHVIEMFTWWTLPGEEAAANALVAYHKHTYNGKRETQVIHSRMGNGSLARSFLDNQRVPRGSIPDTFQANIGKDLFTWLGDAVTMKLEPLALLGQPNAPQSGSLSLWQGRRWTDEFYPAVIDAASQSNNLYCIPLDIHRENTIFYNVPLLQTYGIDPHAWTKLSDFTTACATLKSQGITPIALGIRNSRWTLSLLVNQALLSAVGGPEYYQTFWSGNALTPNVQQDVQPNGVLDQVYRTFSYWRQQNWITPSYATLSWEEAAVQLFATAPAQAAFFVMGDWATAELSLRSYVAGTDFDTVPFPPAEGRSRAFVYTADCFPLPLGALHREDAINLLNTMADKEGQLVFNAVKGSIPARSDIDLAQLAARLGPTRAATAVEFASAQPQQRVLAMAGLLRRGVPSNLESELVSILDGGTPQRILDYWARNYQNLQ